MVRYKSAEVLIGQRLVEKKISVLGLPFIFCSMKYRQLVVSLTKLFYSVP